MILGSHGLYETTLHWPLSQVLELSLLRFLFFPFSLENDSTFDSNRNSLLLFYKPFPTLPSSYDLSISATVTAISWMRYLRKRTGFLIFRWPHTTMSNRTMSYSDFPMSRFLSHYHQMAAVLPSPVTEDIHTHP